MGNVTVGISDMAVSKAQDDVLVTYALGSCVGVAIYDPVASVAGMIHCMLPMSKIDPKKAADIPCMFVDTGLPRLFKRAYALGAEKERIIVKVAGGSNIHDDQGRFKIGERNYAVLRKMLWKNKLLIDAEDVGGSISRTVYMDVATGVVSIRSNGQVNVLA